MFFVNIAWKRFRENIGWLFCGLDIDGMTKSASDTMPDNVVLQVYMLCALVLRLAIGESNRASIVAVECCRKTESASDFCYDTVVFFCNYACTGSERFSDFSEETSEPCDFG
jgi:hypothetical protein